MTAAAGPPLSVTIASRNRRDLLLDTLRALDRQTYAAERFEVVLILDGTTDDSADAARNLETRYELRVLEQANRGLAATRNRGFRDAANPTVVFLDDDILPDPGFLAAHAAAHANSADRHLALGYYPPATDDRSFWAMEVRAWWEDYFRRKTQPAHQWTFMDLSDGNASVHRDLLADAGGWDEHFTGGRRQDWDLGARLLGRGVRFAHYPDARGSHRLDTSYATAVRNAREEGRWDVLLARKHPALTLRLPFAQFARVEGGAMSRRGRFAYRYRGLAGAMQRAAVPAVAALERLNLHGAWRRLNWLVLAHEYVQGVARELPTLEELREFVADTAVEVSTVPLVLGGAPPAIDSPVAPVEVEAQCDGTPLASVRAPLSGEQWDWDDVVGRLVRALPVPPPADVLRCVTAQASPAAGEVIVAWGESVEASIRR